MSQFANQLKKTLQAARARKKVQGTEIPPVTRVIFLRPVAHPCASSVDLLYVIEPHESYDPVREPRKPIIFVWDLCSDLDGARIPSTRTTRRHVFDHETGQYKDIGLHTAIYPGFVSQLVVPVDSNVTADTSAKPGIDERIGDADYLEFLLSHPERFYIKEYVGSVQQRTLSLLRMGAVVMIGDDVTHSSHDDMDFELSSDKKERKSVKRSRDSMEVENEDVGNSAPMTFISLDPENKKHRGDKTIGMMHVDTLVGGVPLPLAPMMMTRTWLEESGAKQIAEELVQVCLSVTARNFRTQTCMTNALQYYYDQLFSACDLYTGRKDEENKIKKAVLTLWVYKTNQLYNLTHGKYYKYLLRFSNTSVTWTNEQIQRVNDERQQVIRQRKRPRAKAGTSKESRDLLTVNFERGPGENEAYDAWHERQDKIRQRNLLESIQKNQPEVVGRGLGGIVCRYPYQIKSSPRTPQWAIDFFESLENVKPPLTVPDELYHYGMVFSDPNDINTILQEIAEDDSGNSSSEDESEDEGVKRMEEVD